MKTLAGNYFTSHQDSVYTYMTAMSKVYDGGATDTATNVGWTIGRLVAKERLTPATTTGAAGGAFLTSLMQCMSDVAAGKTGGKYPALAIPDSFSVHAASVLTSGIWEVRGGNANSQLPAAGRVIDNASHVRNFGEPRWGVEAVSGTWPGAIQYAVFGYPTNIGALVLGSAGDINQNEVEANSFELGTIPAATSKSGLRVGVCIGQDVTQGVANRILHSNSEILDVSNLTQICTLPISLASAQLHPTWYASALSRVGSYLAPAPLFAQPPFGDCGDSCIGGLPSDWSPFSPSGIVAGNVVLTIVTQPKDVKEVLLSGAPNDPVTIRATANGLPVPGVVVDSIEVFNNSGSPAGAIVTAFSAGAPTGSNGQTTATFGIGKPGGYLIVIFASLDGSSTKTVTSAMFHIKNS